VAQEFLHAGVREHREQRFDRSSNLAAQRSSCTSIIETRDLGDVGTSTSKVASRQRREMTQLRHGAHLHEGPERKIAIRSHSASTRSICATRAAHFDALLGLKDALTKACP